MRHWLTCWATSRYKRWKYHQPFWRDDLWAQANGWASKGCPRCGRGAVVLDAQ